MNFCVNHYFAILVLLYIACPISGQKYSVYNPFITNYTKQLYKGGTENWDAACSSDGQVFIANNEGLLSFNGHSWTLLKLPNKTIVRSVELDTIHNRIYVGGQDEVGYFSANNRGQLNFTSIRHHLPHLFKALEDVWDIYLLNGKVYFRSVNTIFSWDEKQLIPLTQTSKRIQFLKIVHKRVIYSDVESGLFELIGNKSVFIPGSEILRNTRVSDILPLPAGHWLVITEKDGIFQYDGKTWTSFLKDRKITSAILNSATYAGPGKIAVATVREGILIFDFQGNFLYQMTHEQGLQTNSIIQLTADPLGNIWVCTSNGIDKVLLQSPFRVMYPDQNLRGGVYAVVKYNNRLYVGTNNGLYYTAWNASENESNTSTFREVANTGGQVWGLDIVNGDLLMGHNEGSYQVIGDKAVKLTNTFTGTWKHIAMPGKDIMLAGTYGGFERFLKKGNQWVYDGHVSGFEESARITAMDSRQRIWVSHPYRGVYRLTFTQDASAISKKVEFDKGLGLPSDLDNYISTLNQQIYVSGDKGIFQFHETTGKFFADTALTKYIGSDFNTRRLFQDSGENIWFLTEQECGLLQIRTTPVSKEVNRHMMPFLKEKLIGGFENIYIPDDREIFACTDKGLIVMNMKQINQKFSLRLRFNQIYCQGAQDSILYGGYFTYDETKKTEIPYLQNNVGIYLGTNLGDETQSTHFSWKLDGRNTSWSAWQDKSEILLTHLKPGTYTFFAKAKDREGRESNVIQFTFTISNPWYASWTAIGGYLLLLGGIFFFLTKYLNNKHEGEKTLLIQEKEESEALVQDLLNEKLQTEIDFKNKELALSTMHIVQKNETLAKLREELNVVAKNAIDQETKKQIRKVISILSDDEVLEGDWESFAKHFDQVHTDFIRRLKETYTQLSPKDLKLCAYLRLNLSSKELAPLLNISVRGVEISRYRLRKKLNLHPDINLNDFMMNF